MQPTMLKEMHPEGNLGYVETHIPFLLLMIAMSILIRYMIIYVCYLVSTVIHRMFSKGSLRFEPGD